jgi:hypothetical protein
MNLCSFTASSYDKLIETALKKMLGKVLITLLRGFVFHRASIFYGIKYIYLIK